MSEVKKDEYIEISLTKIIIAIFKNVKTFLLVFLLGVILSVLCVLIYTPKYDYEQIIQPPFYLSEQGEVRILDGVKLNIILNNILASIQHTDPNNKLLNNIEISVVSKNSNENYEKGDTKINLFSLIVNAPLDSKEEVERLYNLLMKDFSESVAVKRQVQVWRDNTQRNIEANNEYITRYGDLIKQNQDYLKELSSQKRLSGIDGQTLLSSYVNRIEGYQKQIFSLVDSQKALKLQLDSLQPEVTKFDDIDYEKNSKFSKLQILVLGVLLSIFLGLFGVFVKVIIKRAIIEYRNSETRS
ncbi:hypothetical protein FRA_34c06550 [Francisella sp. W12-1067]|nr:hypothetical protein FRA_34c06550 [Francisella sp. W12-1067]